VSGSKFFVPRVNVIESTEGFSVEVLGRTGLCYREGDWSRRVDSEVLMGPRGMMIIAPSIRTWNPPYADELIDEARRKQIVERIQAAFRFRGFEIEVNW
jgi:hypothetical protein